MSLSPKLKFPVAATVTLPPASNVKFVDLQSFSDVGDMSKEEFQLRKDHAVQLDGSNFLMNKIINI